MFLFFIPSQILNGPKRSMAVQLHADGLSLSTGSFPIIFSLSLFFFQFMYYPFHSFLGKDVCIFPFRTSIHAPLCFFNPKPCLAAFLNGDFGCLWYIADSLAVILISLPKIEYLLISILGASVSFLLYLCIYRCIVCHLTSSGSCSFVNDLQIGYSLSGSSGKLSPFCQMLQNVFHLEHLAFTAS